MSFITAVLLSCLPALHAVEIKCNIKVFERDTDNWRDIFAGMLLGLHSGGNITK